MVDVLTHAALICRRFLHGCVRVGHGVAWWGMGAALWVLYPIVADLSETIVAAVATPGSASVGM